MKRFYAEVAVEAGEGGFGVLLDRRPVRTPARAALRLPTSALARAVAGEWRGQGETIDPRAMPLTGLANAAIDRVAPDVAGFGAPLAAYAESDATCFRAAEPEALVAAEREAWDPLVEWARRRLDLAFVAGEGLSPPAQPPETRARVEAMLTGLDPFRLAGVDRVVRLAGSVLIGLAVLHGRLDGEGAFAAGHVEELWQAGVWGEDALAAAARAERRAAMVAAAHFLTLLE